MPEFEISTFAPEDGSHIIGARPLPTSPTPYQAMLARQEEDETYFDPERIPPTYPYDNGWEHFDDGIVDTDLRAMEIMQALDDPGHPLHGMIELTPERVHQFDIAAAYLIGGEHNGRVRKRYWFDVDRLNDVAREIEQGWQEHEELFDDMKNYDERVGESELFSDLVAGLGEIGAKYAEGILAREFDTEYKPHEPISDPELDWQAWSDYRNTRRRSSARTWSKHQEGAAEDLVAEKPFRKHTTSEKMSSKMRLSVADKEKILVVADGLDSGEQAIPEYYREHRASYFSRRTDYDVVTDAIRDLKDDGSSVREYIESVLQDYEDEGSSFQRLGSEGGLFETVGDVLRTQENPAETDGQVTNRHIVSMESAGHRRARSTWYRGDPKKLHNRPGTKGLPTSRIDQAYSFGQIDIRTAVERRKKDIPRPGFYRYRANVEDWYL